jgi:hypothetical protein
LNQQTGRWHDSTTHAMVRTETAQAGNQQAQQQAPADRRPAHPDWLVRQAANLGFENEDLEQSSEQLIRAVNREQSRRLQYQQEQSRARTLQGDDPQAQLHQAARDVPVPQLQQPEGVQPMDELDDINPTLAKHLRQIPALLARIEALEAALASVKAVQDDHRTRSAWQVADALIAKYGDPAVFGQGPMTALRPDSWPARNRRAVSQVARELAGPKADDRAVLQRFHEAMVGMGFAKLQEQPAPPQSNDTAYPANGATAQQYRVEQVNGQRRYTPDEWREGALATPTHRSGAPEPKDEQVAVANLTERMRSAGMLGTPGEDRDILDTLL